MNIGTPLIWGTFFVFVVAALAVDIFAMRRQGAHRVGMREAAIWSLVWVLVSFVFVGWLWWYLRGTAGPEIANTKALGERVRFPEFEVEVLEMAGPRIELVRVRPFESATRYDA